MHYPETFYLRKISFQNQKEIRIFHGSLEVLGAATSISTQKLKKTQKTGGIAKYFVN